MAIPIDGLLRQVPLECKGAVDRAQKELRPKIQAILRNETRLSRKHSDPDERDLASGSVNVPVIVADASPAGLLRNSLSDSDPISLLIASYRIDLESASNGLVRLDELVQRLAKTPEGQGLLLGREEHIPSVRQLLDDLLSRIVDIDLTKIILALKDNFLGKYFYRTTTSSTLFETPSKPRIELYWAAIAFVANQLYVSVEDLTAVVLAHEQSHAYTHLGNDADGRVWDDSEFERTERPLLEGLAQYYTAVIARRLREKRPGVYEAYDRLLSKQPEDYRTHLPWVEEYSPEAVRISMLEIRRQRTGTLGGFNVALDVARNRLGHTNVS